MSKRKAGLFEEDNAAAGARGGSRRTSTRSKQWAAGFRIVDDQTRREQNQARLETLERENYDDRENNLPEDEDFKVVLDSDDDEGDVFSKRPTKRRKIRKSQDGPKRRRVRYSNFNQVLDHEHYDAYPASIPTYLSIAARPSVLPPRVFCFVCGQQGPYSCPRCGVRFCSVKCDAVHKESRCQKFIQ